MGKTSEAQKRAIYRYDDKFDRINCRLEKGVLERIESLGYKSANAFMIEAVKAKLEKEEKGMKWLIKFEKEVIGEVLANHSMTDEEICECAGVELAITEEDFLGMPENGKYAIEELEIEPR